VEAVKFARKNTAAKMADKAAAAAEAKKATEEK
jgi:hypothetical protein